jgi:hypothetical protein
MKEEVNLEGDFTFEVIDVDEPKILEAHNLWQLRLIFVVQPSRMVFSAGEDGDEVAFLDPTQFEKSPTNAERRIYKYYKLLQG